jgi:hypothetical protein
MTEFQAQIIDPMAPPGLEKKTALPYGQEAEEELDVSEVPTLAVDKPWESIKGAERGEAIQQEATTALGEQFKTDEYAEPDIPLYGGQYQTGIGASPRSGPDMGSPEILKSLGLGIGQSAITGGISSYMSSKAAQEAGRAAFNNALMGGMGETAATETASRATEEAAGSSSGAGSALAAAGAFYGGYSMAPAVAGFEQTYLGGYSPGYIASGALGPQNMLLGGRTDPEAKKARGERLAAMGVGGGLGFLSGGPLGAVAGTAGAFFAENPATGKRGYQEMWKYDVKPWGQKVGKDINLKAYGDIFKGKFDFQKLSGTGKGGMFRSLTNFKNWGDQIKGVIPGMGGMGGGGKKPPKQGQIKRDVQFGIAKNVHTDYQIQEWWKRVADKGSAAGREYIKGGLETEGREWGKDEALPDWVLSGAYGKGKHAWQFGPEEIGGQRVASARNVNTLAGLQAKMEEMGNRKKFYETYMKDYNMFQEGGKGLTGSWHGKQLYNVPSEASGRKVSEIWGDIDFKQDYSKNLDWLQTQEEEEGEG